MSVWRRELGWILGVILLQWWLAPLLAWREVRPDFVLLFVLYIALYAEPVHAMVLGFALGILVDSLTWSPFGLNALILTTVAFVPHLLRSRLFLSSVATQLAFIVFFTLGGTLIHSLYSLMVGQQTATDFSTRIGIGLFWNLLFYGILFRRWIKWLPIQEK